MTNNERKSEYDRCAGNDGMHEDSLVEGMKELMPVYCVIGKIPAVRNISNKIIVLEKRGRY